MSTEGRFAVVGLGGIFPGANTLDQFWKNILDRRVLIEPIPKDSIEREVFFRPETEGMRDKGDRSYTDLRATVKDFTFDPHKYRIPPRVASRMDTNQKLSILCVEQAMAAGGLSGVDPERVGVFMGNTMIGQLHHDYLARLDCDKFEYYLRRHPIFQAEVPSGQQQQLIEDLRTRLLAHTVPTTEDTAPGLLPNIIAARINAVFDLHGHAFVLDAACASGLAAIICGIQQLRLGECDAVICGAADFQNEEVGRVYFSALGALSAQGSFPFDERASGFVVGDGAGAVILRRLDDAVKAGNRILAVITGYGQASDGRGKAIAAPNEIWQAKTIKRAWEMAGVSADTVELIEAHGTSTQVGDLSEVNALKSSFQQLGVTRSGFCGLGSVKSNIGHLKSAAGIAGFVKTVMALDRKVLPPTAGFVKENPKLQLAGSPFYVLSEAREWRSAAHPRRAGVSAFGFGGADYHIALEEYRPGDYESVGYGRGRSLSTSTPLTKAAAVADEAQQTQEVLLLSGASRSDVVRQLELLSAAVQNDRTSLAQVVLRQNLEAHAAAPVRVALLVKSADDLSAHIQTLGPWATGDGSALPPAKGVFVGESPARSMGEVAVMFPGQGSQYPDMLAGIFNDYPSARHWLNRGDTCWKVHAGCGVSELIDSTERGSSATDALLRDTRNTHPALVVGSLAIYRLLQEMGLKPGALLGHSVGEFTALAAGGRLTFRDAIALVYARADAFARVPADARGAMVALPLPRTNADELIQSLGLGLVVANINGPRQVIASGSESDVSTLLTHCEANGVKAIRLNVSHAFHSPLMVPAEEAFRKVLHRTTFESSGVRIIANRTNSYYGESSADVVRELEYQITGSVNFADSIRKLYDDGLRVFVEVGPGSVLTALTKEILAGTDAVVLSSDQKRGNSNDAFLRMVCGLFAAGIGVDVAACTRSRVQLSTSSSADGVAPAQSKGRCVANPPESRKSPGVVDPSDTLTMVPPVRTVDQKIVYSGVSVGLPGSFKNSFADDNFEQLFEGRNLIERLTDNERRRLVDLHISKVVKSERGASFAVLSTLDEVIQLAGKLGKVDLATDYRIDQKEIANMSSAIAHAVAAGYEALRDAHIPLVHEYTRTASGSMLPERWALPKEMQRHTGIIFANGFPMVDPIIREVSRHVAYLLGNKVREELFEFYDSLLQQVTDSASRKILADWYVLNRTRLGAVPTTDEVYTFNHHLMTQISMQANNRLARLINARGPNFQINAACSSTATAISLAEELIRGGRAKRIIVIGGDDPTSHDSLTYLGGGFLSTGACTNSANLYEAALPFDRRRNGMIMGAGAVGIVVEDEAECLRRGVTPLCDLLGTHVFNTAGHASQLDVPRYAEELDNFITRIELEHGLRREKIAPRLVYVSHETYTPPRGGCSEAEAVALRHVFGEAVGVIEISNTKGMTGHTMGASIEDAVAAKSLQFGRAAPVVNHREHDPALQGLKLSQGGPADFSYALRMAAGFGSQGNYILLGKRADSGSRVFDRAAHESWLRNISGLDQPELAVQGRALVVKDTRPGSVVVDRPSAESCRPQQHDRAHSASKPAGSIAALPVAIQPAPQHAAAPSASLGSAVQGEVASVVFGVVSEVTGYPTSILELDMDLEADLGVDTVKQATILANLAERFGLKEFGSVRLSEYPSLRAVVQLYERHVSGGASEPACSAVAQPTAASDSVVSPGTHRATVFEVIAAVTGYAAEILDGQMELEADLGIDTVKQATILSMLAEKAGVPPTTSLRMSELGNVGQLVEWFAQQRGTTNATTAVSAVPPKVAGAAAATVQQSQPEREVPPGKAEPPAASSAESILQALFEIIARVSSYPTELLDVNLSLANDLRLDSAVLGELRQAIVSEFGLPQGWSFESAGTIGALAAAIRQQCDRQGPADKACPEKSSPARSQALGRAEPTLCLAPSGLPSERNLRGLCVCLVGDSSDSMMRIRSQLVDAGAEVFALQMPASGRSEELTALFEQLPPRCPDLVIDLACAPATGSLEQQTPQVMLPMIARAADCRFAFYKHLDEREWRPVRLLAVVCIDGEMGFARVNSVSGTTAGITLGFYKALRREWPGSHVSVLDVAPNDWANDANVAWERILGELQQPGEGVEICYVNGQRHRVVIKDTQPATQGLSSTLSPDEVVVATGGGAGICAEIVREIARQVPCRFMLIGRTDLDPSARGKQLQTEAERHAEKARIQQRLAEQGLTVTPRLIASEFARTERSAQVFATLDALHELGAKAQYVKADVCDEFSLEAALNKARESFGPITMILHGAGQEISHTLAQKSQVEFGRVHAPKTVGAYLLRWLCRNDPLRRFVVLSSIAGRFGNRGQLDYSAANAFLDLMTRTESRAGLTSVSLSWSGWADVGMAWRNSYVRENGELGGLNFIAPAVGARTAIREILAATGHSEVVLHRGLGNVTDAAQAETDLSPFPMVDWVDRSEGVIVRAHRRFSTRRDAVLDQHRFAGVPLMPGVAFMEMMSEVAQLCGGQSSRCVVFSDLAFLEAFKLYRDEPRDVYIDIVNRGDAGLEMQVCSALAHRANVSDERRVYARARVRTTSEPPRPPLDPATQMPWSKETDYGRVLPDARNIRQNVIFGPLFNEARNPEQPLPSRIRWDSTCIEATVPLPQACFSHPQYPLSRFNMNPSFLDSLHQAGAVLAIELTSHVYLPVAAEEFMVCDPLRVPGNYRVLAQLKHLDDQRAVYDMVMTREDGTLCAAITNSTFQRVNG